MRIFFSFARNAKSFTIVILIAFASNAKSFQIVFLFLLLLLLVSIFRRTEKRFFPYFIYCCFRPMRPISDLLTRYAMCFRAIYLEVNNNGGFKRKHVESCPSTTKNISPLPKIKMVEVSGHK